MRMKYNLREGIKTLKELNGTFWAEFIFELELMVWIIIMLKIEPIVCILIIIVIIKDDTIKVIIRTIKTYPYPAILFDQEETEVLFSHFRTPQLLFRYLNLISERMDREIAVIYDDNYVPVSPIFCGNHYTVISKTKGLERNKYIQFHTHPRSDTGYSDSDIDCLRYDFKEIVIGFSSLKAVMVIPKCFLKILPKSCSDGGAITEGNYMWRKC